MNYIFIASTGLQNQKDKKDFEIKVSAKAVIGRQWYRLSWSNLTNVMTSLQNTVHYQCTQHVMDPLKIN